MFKKRIGCFYLCINDILLIKAKTVIRIYKFVSHFILSEVENSMELDINDDEAYLDIRGEFIEENVQKFEAMLRDILFNQKIKEVKITIRTYAIDHDIQIKRCFDAKDICWN